jgi:hypothetical protein
MRTTFRQSWPSPSSEEKNKKKLFKANMVFFVGQKLSNDDWITQSSINREAGDKRDIVQTGQVLAEIDHFYGCREYNRERRM